MKRILILMFILLFSTLLVAQNRGLTALKSLAVPGWSQASSGRDRGYLMLTAEAVIIGSLYYFNSESDLLKQNYYEYAVKYAHLAPGSYPDLFFKQMGIYDSNGFDAGGYNNWVRQTARELYPNDPVLQQQFIDENCYQDDHYWSWDSMDNRREYNKIRNRSNDFRDYAMVTGGVLILNHLISAIDAMRWTAPVPKTDLSFSVLNKTPIVQVNYHW